MKLKTYRAASMAEALQAVKKDLGKNAVILHTRTLKVGGFLGFGRRTVVELTASDQAPGGGGSRSPLASRAAAATDVFVRSGTASAPATPRAAREPEAPVSRARPVAVELEPAMKVAAATTVRAAPMPAAPVVAAPVTTAVPIPAPVAAAVEPAAKRPEPVPTPPPSDSMVMPVRERRVAASLEIATNGPASAFIQRELADIKLLVSQVLASSPPAELGGAVLGGGAAGGGAPDALFRHYLKLLESQVSREIADRIVHRVRAELGEAELTDEASVRACMLRQLSGLIPVAEAAPVPMRSPGGAAMGGRLGALGATEPGRPFVVALVGPTGVGKTTTIAKLAATYRLRHGRSVAMITADTYRIAAVDQLRTYASIIGLPLKVVLTPAEMAAAVEAFSAHDVVLIDTAGRSQRNTERLGELSAFLDAAKPDETHLVLSSAAAQEVLLSAAEAFKVLSPNRVILTKLDEAVNFGVVVNVMQRLKSKLSFVTMGQEVPDHIEPGRPDRLAKLILGGEPLGAGGFADGCTWLRSGAMEVGA